MRKMLRRGINKYWKKSMEIFFASLMVFQILSTSIDVIGYEMGKVNSSSSTGKYYNQEIQRNTEFNEESEKEEASTLQKEPALDAKQERFNADLEVKSKRTVNSKTYKMPNGEYVQEMFFEPIHKKEGKEFIEIDNTLENTSKLRSAPIYENKDGLYAFKIQDNKVSIEDDFQNKLSFINEDKNLSTFDRKDNVILYSEVYENIDMEYRLRGDSVHTNFYVNGPTSNKEIQFSIEKGDLEVKEENDALLFLENDEVIYSYVKPQLNDVNGKAKEVSFTYKENRDKLDISIIMNGDMQSVSNAYPFKLQTRAIYDPVKINVDTSYNRSKQPSIISTYYDLFVGYERGFFSTINEDFGACRTYIHLSGLNLGADKEIVGAQLNVYKKVADASQWNTIEIGKSQNYIAPKDCKWNNKPSVSPISTTNIGGSIGWQSLDVTSYVDDIYKGVNNIIELKATNESDSFLANVFFGESSAVDRPTITISYKDAWDVDINLPMDTFDTEMRLFSIFNKGFEAFSFDGIARPDSQVVFDLVEREKDEVIQSETSKGNSNRYFVDPIYILKYLENTQRYPKTEVNYTTDYIYKNRIPEFDVPYEYKVKVKAGSVTSTKEFRSDSFIKYKVKTGDNLKSIAAYYGLSIEEIKVDNNLTKNTIQEDDILIIRFKKNNDKVSKDVYTPPVKTVTYKAKYVDRGANCVGGICPVIDPVNSTTGNYYAEEKDFTIKDAEEFDFLRYYNSTGPRLSNMFGNGFTTPIESYLSYDKKGNMLYFAGDGRIFEFEKDGASFKAKPQDKMEVSLQGEMVTIKDVNTDTTYRFDVYGYIDTITSKEGIVTKVNYNTEGLITSVKVGERTLSFTYNESKLVKDITLPSGKKTTYEYDKNRNLTTFTDTLGNKKKYDYDSNNYLVSISDKNNVEATKNTYDNEGRVLKQVDGKGNVSTIEYEDKKSILKNADGSVEEYIFDENYDTLRIIQDGVETSSYTYDNYRNITSVIDADGKEIKHTYDKENLIKSEYSDGTYEEYRYDANDNVIYQRDREGKETITTYDVNNDILSIAENNKAGTIYEYDNKRRVAKETDPFGAVKSYTYVGNMIASITYSNGLVESFEYDVNGNTLKESDNQGKVSTYVYNANNEITQKNHYDGSNEQWRYDANGNIVSYQNRIGGITTNTYDKNNNLIASKKGSVTTSKVYNEINQLISETNEQGHITSYSYDMFGNKVTETDKYGNTTSFEYDANQNVIKTIDVYGNEEINEYEDKNLVKTISKEGLITTFEYDSLNREVKKTNPNGTAETKEYTGLLLSKEIDAKETVIEHIYDSFDREYKTITTYSDGVVSTTQNTFDIYGNVVETNTDGRISKTTYNVYNQVTSTTDALGNTTRQEYDLDGNIIKEIDALGNASMTEYDGNQNVLSTTDKNGNTESKTYDVNGLLVSEKDALGFIKTYTYNAKGQVVEVKDAYNNISTFSYDAFGNQIETKLEDKVIETKAYDKFGREILVETLEAKTSTKLDDFDRKVEETNELTGLTTYYFYDAFGNVTKQEDSEGLTTTFECDVFNRKVKSIDAYGREEKTIYNVRDQALETKAFDGLTTTSVYDNFGNVIESTDGLGKVTKNTYNALNQLVKEEAGSKVSEYVYDVNGQRVEVKSINNNTSTKNIYDKNGNTIETIDALGYSTKTEYDAKNQVIASIGANGNRSTKEYDAYGNVLKETNALGYAKQTKFNKYGLKELEVDERGFDTKYEYNDDLLLDTVIDSNGNELEVFYNENKQKIKEVNPNGGVTQFSYDAYGREIKTIAPNDKVTTKEYDALGNVVKEISGRKTTINTYDKLGRVKETSINGVIQSTNKYNKFNQIIESKDANKNKSTFKYDVNGNIVYANEKGSISEKEYDVYGNLVKQVDNEKLTIETVYDLNNNVLEIKINGNVKTVKKYDSNGNEVKVIENGAEIRKAFDQENRLIQVELPSVNNSDEFIVYQSVEYDETGNVLKSIDANGNVEEKKYDANNNVIEETNKKGIKTLYEFDGLNNVVKVQNHKERYVSYTYDQANNVKFKNINNKYAEYTYDIEGNLVADKNENGYTSRYSYDNFNRKIEQIKPDGSTISYKYDDLGNLISENSNVFTYDARGNVMTSTNKEGTVKNVYDAFNNKVETVDTGGKKVKNTFSDDNKLIKKEYADIEVKYSYNAKGFLDKVLKDDKTVSKYEYNERNEIVSKTQNNIITQKKYDDMGRILTRTTSKSNDTIENISYTYDANDNIVKEVIDGKENTYVYDGYDELIESHKYINGKKVDTKYKQDIFGNQVSSSSNEGKKTYKYNEKGQIATIDTDKGIIKYSYNDNGNVSKKVNENGRIDIYTYDDLNQLTKLEQGQFTYDYRYDAEKERIQQVRTDTKDYHYDQWYNYVEPLEVVGDKEIEDTFKNLKEQAKKKQDNGNVCTSVLSDSYDVTYFKEPEVINYTVDRSMEYSEVLQAENAVNVYGDTLLQTDEVNIISGLNNSVIAKVDDTNIKKISYSDYGATKDITSGNGYNGEMLDQTGLIYLRARYYDPSVSRFVQIDNNYNGEKEHVASQNKYVYTLNNPYKYVDKDGNKATACPPSIAGATSGILGALSYLFMNDKDFQKWIVKKPIWQRPIYILNRAVLQAKLKNDNNQKTDSGNGKNNSTGNGGGSTSNLPTSSKDAIVVICPKPNQPNYSIYASQPIEVRIRESSRLYTGTGSPFVSDTLSFAVPEKSDLNNTVASLVDLGGLTISLAKKSNPLLDVTIFTLSKLVSALRPEETVAGSYFINLYWHVRRKEVDIKYPHVGYTNLFKVDVDEADGTIEKVKTKTSGKEEVLRAYFSEGAKSPSAVKFYYPKYYDNTAIAKDAALFKTGYSSGTSLVFAQSKLKGINFSTKFDYGQYLYYTVNMK